MNIPYSSNDLLQVFSDLYTIMKIRINIVSAGGKLVFQNTEPPAFCARLQRAPGGLRRCTECDMHHTAICGRKKNVHFYRCHAGLCEAIIPIPANDSPVFFLTFGQYLDETPADQQWQNVRKQLAWYPGDPEELKKDFLQLHTYSQEEVEACADILKIMGTCLHMSRLLKTVEISDMQRLELYIEQHYTEKISLSSISRDLEISRTKLCYLAKQLSGNKTLSHLIAERRVEAAKLLLMESDMPISSVSEAVGILDYNYFTKVFRRVTGTTPTAFRRENRRSAQS